MNLDTKSVRFLARMGARGTLGQAMYEFACEGNDFYAVSADLAHASGFDRLIKDFPDKVVDVGIAEQNLIGVSAGLASFGTPVVATTWSMFASARVADQVRNFMGYMQKNIKLIGMDSGFVQSRFSYSHSNPPDIAIMRAIPGIVILSPCDGVEIYKAMEAALRYNGPVFVRLTGMGLLPIVHENPDFLFEIGKSITLTEGDDIAIIATGNVVKSAVDAAKILQKENIPVRVIDMHTIEPLDEEILKELQTYKLVITAEEHLLHGGLGAAIAEFYAGKELHPKQISLGVNNCYPAPGSMNYTLRTVGLSAEQIAETIKNNI